MNSRTFFLFLFFIVACWEVYPQMMEVIYQTDYTFNAANPEKIKTDQTALNIHIESGVSEFYSLNRARLDSVREAINESGGSLAQQSAAQRSMPQSLYYIRVYKNIPKKGTLTFTDQFAINKYKYTETLERPVWILEDEGQEIAGYSCQKAKTTFKGRVWTAWYAPEIPIQEGPWKLWGLPGLILSAYDEHSLYSFVAVGLKQKSEASTIEIPVKRYINCTRKEYLKQKSTFEMDPAAGFKASGIAIRRQDGKPIEPIATEYIDIELPD